MNLNIDKLITELEGKRNRFMHLKHTALENENEALATVYDIAYDTIDGIIDSINAAIQ